ncbi:MAG TPA: Ku protein, partial [Oryzihumus sp.]|nr:Ku protein [Oryzihumus sp.]
VRDDVIVMQTMLWPDEVRSPEFVGLGDAETEAKPAELAMANMLVESLAGDYDPDDYEDDYQQAVEALVKAKLEGGEVQEAPAAKDTSGEVVDLLAALQRSVERAKASRGEPVEAAEPEEKPAGKAPARKAPARKAPAAKTAAKRAPAKKTAARKAAEEKPRKKAAS